MRRQIDVLVVEDSRVVLDHLVYILGTDPDIHVTATASTGEEALEIVSLRKPDVIVMDIHLPGMDGFETTRRIMESDPVPIVIVTASANFSDVSTAMQAMQAGALAALRKPGGIGGSRADSSASELIRTVKLMSEVKLVRRWKAAAQMPLRPPVRAPDSRKYEVGIVAIGASTGGPPAILKILSCLPAIFPAPILIVQHISPGFTAGFVEWMASSTGLQVHTAIHGEILLPNHAYVAPDDRHLVAGPGHEIILSKSEPVNGHRPSVSVLFRSVAERYGDRAVGVLLTGMGSDGAEELGYISERGGLTIAQDEESSIVWGMPGRAIGLGAARYVLPPLKIGEILKTMARHEAAPLEKS
jgi:two-component system chemotaxis response regulator CheB